MQKKELFIHIGLHKTASTTIQSGLVENRDVLQSNGFLYPQTGQVSWGHHNIAWSLYNDARYVENNGTLTELIEEITENSAKSIILSSEDFSFVKPEGINLLKSRLENFDVYFVVYLRRQDQWLQSIWAEFTKSGKNELVFVQWLDQELSKPESDLEHRGNYWLLLQKWNEVFGNDKIIVRIFEKSHISGHVLSDFLIICGFKAIEHIKLPEDLNISPSLKTLEVIRLFSVRLNKYKVDVFETQKIMHAIRIFAGKNEWNREKLNLINSEIYERTTKKFAEINTLVAKSFLGKKNLFKNEYKKKKINEFTMNEVQTEELLDLFAFVIFKQFQQSNRKKNKKGG